MPRPKQSTVRVQRDSYTPKGGTPTERWRVFVHYRSPTGDLTRKSFLAPRGSSRAAAEAMGRQRLAQYQAADAAETRDAVALARALRTDPSEPLTQPATRPTNTSTPTVAEFSERYLVEFCEANRQAPGTLYRKRSVFRVHVVPVLGDIRLGAFTGLHVQRLKTHMAGYSARSVNTVLGVLRAMFRVAAEWKVIPEAPRVRLIKVPEDEPDWFEVDEYEALCKAASTMNMRTLAVVLLGGDCGCRIGEMMGLRWDAVDWKRDRIVIRATRSHKGEKPPKNGKIRHVPMTPNVRLTLRALWADKGHREYVLWTTERRSYPKGREPLHPGLPCSNTIRNWLRAAEDRADVTPKHVHALRHTFVSHLAERLVPTPTIMKLAGHQDLRTTQRYTHVATAAPADGIRALDRAPLFRDTSTTRAKSPEPAHYLQ